MLLKSIAVPNVLEELGHAGTPVVDFQLPIALSRAEMVAALFMTASFGDDPTTLSAYDIAECLASAVLCEGIIALHRTVRDLADRPPTDPDIVRLLAAYEQYVDEMLAPAMPAPRPRKAPVRRSRRALALVGA